jgi:hypothetical protein
MRAESSRRRVDRGLAREQHRTSAYATRFTASVPIARRAGGAGAALAVVGGVGRRVGAPSLGQRSRGSQRAGYSGTLSITVTRASHHAKGATQPQTFEVASIRLGKGVTATPAAGRAGMERIMVMSGRTPGSAEDHARA